MSLQLLVIAGPDKGRSFTLLPGPDLMLGRGDKTSYRLADLRVSRIHAQLLVDGDTVTVRDNGGSGGTLVNGKLIKERVLALGDVVQVGDTQMRLQIGDLPLAVAPVSTKPVPSSADRLEALSGQTLSHYQIGPVLGRGQSSVIFHATDTKDNRSVALKVLLPEFSRDEEEMERLIRAMRLMLPLRRPNLVAIHGAGKTGPYCWVAMEYVAGETLKQVIKRIGVAGMLDWRHAYRAAVEVGRALGYAHDQGIIHRNVTPENILRDATSKVCKLGDLMLAKALEGNSGPQITNPGALLGDVEYLSPERTQPEADVDGRSDLYSLGTTVYALLTGRPPFEADTLIERITRIRQAEPVKPTKYHMAIPSAFEGVVLKLLAKKPDDRYLTSQEMLKDLERAGKLQGLTV